MSNEKEELEKIRDFWNVNSLEEAKFERVSKSKTVERSKKGFDDDHVMQLVNDYILIDKLKKECRVLDFGCGVGRILKHMPKFSNHCYGIDISPMMLKYAKQHIDNDNVNLSLYNDVKLELEDDFFDIVYSFHVLQHIPTKARLENALKEIYRVQKKGGTAILHFIYKVSESDKPAGSFAGFRPRKNLAIGMCLDAGFYLEGFKYVEDKGSFVLYLGKK